MNFLITYSDKEPLLKLKRQLLIKLIDGIKKYFPENRIILVSSTFLPEEIKNKVQFFIENASENCQINNYHGSEHMNSMKKGYEILNQFSEEYHYYICYEIRYV